MPFEAGRRLGRYRIIALLGSGGMGDVYRAHDSRLDRDVAIKLLKQTPGSPDSAAAAMAEARAASALTHAHVCTLHEVDEVEGHTFLVMELVEGQTLAAVIGRRGLPAERATRYAAQIASALAHAHERQVIHRDLKSANVMITPDGRVKVLDFGIARRTANPGFDATTRSIAAFEAPGVVSGTLAYMAPEVIQGSAADARSDIWSFGIVMFEMLTGSRPFEGGSAFELASSILHAALPELPADTPSGLRRIMGRCLSREPGERYQSANEVAAALAAISTDATPLSSKRARVAPGLTYAAFALLAITAGVLSWLTWGRDRDAAIGSLVVLPFADLSAGERSEYLADGVTDAVITELGQLGALRVISRTSSMRFRDSGKSIQEIARELGVDAVLEGSLVRDEGRVRVTARLMRAATESSLWTGSYDRELGDILALQRDFAKTVARELRLSLTPDQTSELERQQPVNPEAVEAYLKGRYQWAKRTPASLLFSIELFEAAIRADPSYAAPHAGLANVYVLLGLSEIAVRSPAESLRQAKAEAALALALDPRTAEAHTALGYALLWSWDLAESERAFQRAIELNPSDATTRFWHAVRLTAEGRFEEAIAEARFGQKLDPVSPIITAGLSFVFHLAGRHADAEEYARRTLEIEPDFYMGLSRLGVAHKQQRAYDRAVDALQRAVTVSGRHPDALAQLGQTYALQGRIREARQLLDELNVLSESRYVPAFARVLVFAGLGERDEAFNWLERAYDERYGPLMLLRVDPNLAALRDDPRFEEFARRIHVTPSR